MKFRKNFFTEQLRKAMFENKLTQEQLGKKIGVNRQMISRWLTADRNPSLPSIKKLASALNVSVNYFIDGSNTKIKSDRISYKKETINSDLIIELIKKENKKLEQKVNRHETQISLLKKEIELLKNNFERLS